MPDICNKIISLIPSADLRNAIRTRNHEFSPRELATLVHLYAPTFDEMLNLWKELGNNVPEIEEFTNSNILWKRISLEHFKENEKDSIYELHIKDDSSWEERYLCSSFDDAINTIDAFYEEYDFKEESEDTTYTIVKKRIYGAGTYPLSEDILGTAVLGQGKMLRTVEHEAVKFSKDCDGVCVECKNKCIEDDDIKYPDFITDLTPVRIIGGYAKGMYGIIIPVRSGTSEEYVYEYYTVTLDKSIIHHTDLQEYCFLHHEHISPADIEILSFENIPDEIKEAYTSVRKYHSTNI